MQKGGVIFHSFGGLKRRQACLVHRVRLATRMLYISLEINNLAASCEVVVFLALNAHQYDWNGAKSLWRTGFKVRYALRLKHRDNAAVAPGFVDIILYLLGKQGLF